MVDKVYRIVAEQIVLIMLATVIAAICYFIPYAYGKESDYWSLFLFWGGFMNCHFLILTHKLLREELHG